MDTTEKKMRDPDRERTFGSPLYRAKIKRMVESVKGLRGIPHGQKIPKGPKGTLKSTATEKERDLYHRQNSSRLTIETLHYFAEMATSERLREAQPAPAPVPMPVEGTTVSN